MPEAMFALVVLVAIFVVVNLIRHARRVDESWTAVAAKLSLKSSPVGWFRRRSMAGKHLGHPVRVWSFQQGSGQSTQIYTRFTVRYPALRLGLRLEHQGLVSKIKGLFGGMDHLIGHPMFDDNVVIKGRNVRDLAAFLTQERQVRILRALESFPGLVIRDAHLVHTVRGQIADAGRLESTIRRLCELARVLHHDYREDSTLGRGLKAQRQGRLDEALELVREAGSRDRDDVDARVVEGGILLTSGRYDEAARVLDDAAKREPGDAQIEGLVGAARRLEAARPRRRVKPKKIGKRRPKSVEREPAVEKPPPPPIPTLEESGLVAPGIRPRPPEERPPAPEPVEPETAPEEIDLASVCEELFGADSRSFDTARVFEEKYAGREVSGSGKLVRADSYYRDMVFGDGPGARATLKIHEVNKGPYGGREVQAVIQLPEGTDDKLRPHRDAMFAFEGTLVRCDAFMRNLFVADGFVVMET